MGAFRALTMTDSHREIQTYCAMQAAIVLR